MRYLEDVLELINSQNNLKRPIGQSNTVISLPDNLLPEVIAGQGDRNTKLTLEGILEQGYKGQTQVYYTRLDLNRLFQGLSPRIRNLEFSHQMVLDEINATYGLHLEPADLEAVTVPSFADSPLETSKIITLKVIDNSYRWAGQVDIDLRYGNPRIEPLVMVQLIPMLNHPTNITTLGGRSYGPMVTYGFDFTYWKPQLTIDPDTGMWEAFTTVQDIGALAGLGYWYNGPVVDLPTSDVSDANPDFERVMVQYSPGGEVKGSLYFHYDVNW